MDSLGFLGIFGDFWGIAMTSRPPLKISTLMFYSSDIYIAALTIFDIFDNRWRGGGGSAGGQREVSSKNFVIFQLQSFVFGSFYGWSFVI